VIVSDWLDSVLGSSLVAIDTSCRVIPPYLLLHKHISVDWKLLCHIVDYHIDQQLRFPCFAGKTMLSLPASLSKCRSKVARSPWWICRLAWLGTSWRLQETGASVRKNSWSKEVRFEPRDALCINHRGQCSLDSGTIKKDEKYANAEILSMNIQWHYKLSCWPLMVIPDFDFIKVRTYFNTQVLTDDRRTLMIALMTDGLWWTVNSTANNPHKK